MPELLAFYIFVSSSTKPQDCSRAQQQNIGQAAEAELQMTRQKISDTHKDRVGRLPKWLGRDLFKGCMLVRSLSTYKKLYEIIIPCSYLGTNLEDKNPCPMVGQQLTVAIPQHLLSWERASPVWPSYCCQSCNCCCR